MLEQPLIARRSATVPPDGALRSLYAEFDRLLAEYNALPDDVPIDEHWMKIDAVNAKIRAIPAQTVDGLIVKALVTRWDTNLDPDPTTPRECWDWDVKCFDWLIQELRRYGAGRAER